MAKIEKLIFFLGLFISLLLPPMDPDLGWHLRCGEIITKGQGFCQQNQFSSFMSDYHWTNHHWLYQTSLFLVWKKFGFWGLSIFNAIIVTTIFFVFNLIIKGYHLEKKLAIILTLILSWGVFSFGIRSQLLGILYFVLVFLLVFKEKFICLPLIFLVWANRHSSVILGLVFLFLFSLNNLRLVPISFFSFLATIINPFGLKIFEEAYRHFHTAHLEKLIAEWVPPHPLKQIIILSGTIFLVFISNKTFLPLIISFSFLSLKARRNLPFFFILFFVFLFQNKSFKKWLSPWLKKKSLRKDLLLFTSLVILFFGLFVRLPQTLKINSS